MAKERPGILDGPEIDPVRAYSVQTDRLWRLTEFLMRFAPSVGERSEAGFNPGELLDRDTDPEIATARDDAIEAAYLAVEKIARNSCR